MASTPKEIGGRHFRFGKLPPDRAFRVFMILVRNFGGALMSAVGAARASSKGLSKHDIDSIFTNLTGEFFAKLNDAEIQEAIETLLSSVACLEQVPNGLCTLVGTFNGKLFEAFMVAIESAKENFADFLAAGPLLSSLFPKTPTASNQSSPPTSNGTSGSPV